MNKNGVGVIHLMSAWVAVVLCSGSPQVINSLFTTGFLATCLFGMNLMDQSPKFRLLLEPFPHAATGV